MFAATRLVPGGAEDVPSAAPPEGIEGRRPVWVSDCQSGDRTHADRLEAADTPRREETWSKSRRKRFWDFFLRTGGICKRKQLAVSGSNGRFNVASNGFALWFSLGRKDAFAENPLLSHCLQALFHSDVFCIRPQAFARAVRIRRTAVTSRDVAGPALPACRKARCLRWCRGDRQGDDCQRTDSGGIVIPRAPGGSGAANILAFDLSVFVQGRAIERSMRKGAFRVSS